jgi:hypothetical protein
VGKNLGLAQGNERRRAPQPENTSMNKLTSITVTALLLAPLAALHAADVPAKPNQAIN